MSQLKQNEWNKFWQTMFEAFLFGIAVVLIGVIVAKVMEKYYPMDPECNQYHSYELSLFITGFAIQIVNVYIVRDIFRNYKY